MNEGSMGIFCNCGLGTKRLHPRSKWIRHKPTLAWIPAMLQVIWEPQNFKLWSFIKWVLDCQCPWGPGRSQWKSSLEGRQKLSSVSIYCIKSFNSTTMSITLLKITRRRENMNENQHKQQTTETDPCDIWIVELPEADWHRW